MGYLGKYSYAGILLRALAAALRHFQKFYRLDENRTGDRQNLELIQRPRCGVPDRPYDSPSSRPVPFVLRGCSYDGAKIGYACIDTTPDLSINRQ